MNYINDKNLEILYYVYIISSIVTAILFVFIKCGLKINYFDRIIYKNKKGFIEYVIFHVITYFILGLIFGLNNFHLMLVKTIFVEIALNSISKCNIFEINVKYSIYSAFISLLAFSSGGIINIILKSSFFRKSFKIK
mgnify:CR=1 FL=1